MRNTAAQLYVSASSCDAGIKCGLREEKSPLTDSATAVLKHVLYFKLVAKLKHKSDINILRENKLSDSDSKYLPAGTAGDHFIVPTHLGFITHCYKSKHHEFFIPFVRTHCLSIA